MNCRLLSAYAVLLLPLACGKSTQFTTKNVPATPPPAAAASPAASPAASSDAQAVAQGQVAQIEISPTAFSEEKPLLAILTGAPTGISSQSKINVTVGGDSITEYDYSIESGANTCDAAASFTHAKVSDPILKDVSDLPEGALTLCVWGENSDGARQQVATEAKWTKKYEDCGDHPNGYLDSRTVYENAAVPFGSTCVPGTQTRKCQNGVWENWTGSSFSALSCAEAAAASCGAVLHGQSESRTVFKEASVPFDTKCEAATQTRTCNNGTFGAWLGSNYSALSCSVAAPANCGTVAHNGTEDRTVFQSSVVPYGSTCVSTVQTRRCYNGAFGSWQGLNYSEPSCSVAPPADCGNVAHNQSETRDVFKDATVPFGSSCVKETQSRKCENGTFSAWAGSTYSNLTCSVAAPANCGSTLHGDFEYRDVYLNATVPFGSSCVKGTQERQCTNGIFSAWTGSTYSNLSCTVNAPVNCGSTLDGDVQTRNVYRDAVVPNGSSCVSGTQTRQCTTGTFSPWTGSSYTNLSCSVAPPPSALSLSCSTVTSGAATISCNQSSNQIAVGFGHVSGVGFQVQCCSLSATMSDNTTRPFVIESTATQTVPGAWTNTSRFCPSDSFLISANYNSFTCAKLKLSGTSLHLMQTSGTQESRTMYAGGGIQLCTSGKYGYSIGDSNSDSDPDQFRCIGAGIQ